MSMGQARSGPLRPRQCWRAGRRHGRDHEWWQDQSAGGLVGHEASGSGLVTISGDGSLWENTGVFYVGNLGDGTLQLLAGGDLTSTDGYVGTENGSNSEATVNGTGSSWIMSGDFLVGHNAGAEGSVTISAGGLIENRQGILGDLAGSVLDDAGVRQWFDLDHERRLYVGNGGTGTLIVTGGGYVSADEITIANEADSIGTFIIGAALGQPRAGAPASMRKKSIWGMAMAPSSSTLEEATSPSTR